MGAVGMETRYEEAVVKLSESLKASFIESDGKSDDRYAPRILGNDSDCNVNVLDTLKRELCDCTSFALSVAFITASGIQVLAAILAELRDRGIPGRILTSTYLNFNDPDALGKLLEYPNIESRVYQGDLHAKGYFFNKDQISTIIIGSSNLTQTALTCNKEWNILFRSFPDGRLYLQAKEQYEQLWNDEEAVSLTKRWIADYRRYLEENPRPKQTRSSRAFRDDAHEAMPLASDSAASASRPRIVPNKMQQSALEALSVLHGREEPRALLVSATGSGKTYLSALDVERQRPGKVLFVAHRQRILSASLHSYERVLGDAYRYGLLAGDKHVRPSMPARRKTTKASGTNVMSATSLVTAMLAMNASPTSTPATARCVRARATNHAPTASNTPSERNPATTAIRQNSSASVCQST